MRWLALVGFVAGCDKTVIYPTGEDTGCEEQLFYADADGDGFGDVATPFFVCAAPPNTVLNADDCDDADETVHPGAAETCDTIDRDCDGDPIAGATDPTTWYADADADGYGDREAWTVACAAPVGAVSSSTDCDDADAEIHPGGTEICDGIDQDCDNEADDDFELGTWYADEDGDGWGGDLTGVACRGAGDVWEGGDCDDADPDAYPGALETLGDATDSDCDGDDMAILQDFDFEWEEPRNVVAVVTDRHWGLVTAADRSSATSYVEPGLMLTFDRTSQDFAETVVWQNNSSSPYPIGPSVDAVAQGSDVYVGASYYYDASTPADAVYDIAKRLEWNTTSGSYSAKLAYNSVNVETTGETEHLDNDIAIDGTGRAYVVGCGTKSVDAFRVDPAASSLWKSDGEACDADSTSCSQNTGASGSACWVDFSTTPMTATACDGTGCTTWELDLTAETMTASATQTWSPETWTDVNVQGDWAAATDGGGGAVIWSGGTSWDVLAGYDVRTVTASDDGAGGVLVAAAVGDVDGDGLGDIVLAYGDPDALTVIAMPLTNGAETWDATSASATTADDTIFLTAAGTGDASDTVAWAWYAAN